MDGNLLPIPINLDTINRLYGLELTSEQVEEFFASKRETVEEVRTAEDVVVSTVGRELYEKFFRGYTRKQWGVDPSQLSKSVTARVPTRTNRDDRYFGDKFQNMPAGGYTRMFQRMLDNPMIKIMLQSDYREIRHPIPSQRLIYTGPIDEFFDWKLGRLPYRSLRFEHVTLDCEQFQPVAVVNYPQTENFTRASPNTSILRDSEHRDQPHLRISDRYRDPYYPVPRAENEALYKRYEALAATRPDVWFVGQACHISLLQYGSGGRPGFGDVRAHSTEPAGNRHRADAYAADDARPTFGAVPHLSGPLLLRPLRNTCREQSALAIQFIGNRLAKTARTVGMNRREQADFRVAQIVPAGIRGHRVQTYTLNRGTTAHCVTDLIANIMEPCRPA